MLNQHDEKESLDLTAESNLNADEAALLSEFGESRRQFIGRVSTATAAIIAAQLLAEQQTVAQTQSSAATAQTAQAAQAAQNTVPIKLKINGVERAVNVEPRVTLLDALRERLNLTGSKKGCDHGQCGACTVIMNGRRTLSCLTLAMQAQGSNITTIEGLAAGDQLHPVQAAFVKHDGFQCGYCTPGQICSAVALLTEVKNGEASYVTENLRTNAKNLQLSDEEIRERMSGNLCRCGAYPNIVAAIREALTGKDTAQTWQFAHEGEKIDAAV